MLSSLLVSSVVAVGVSTPATADGLAGAYLAGRSASFEYDFRSAADYYTRALVQDPSNPVLMESAILSQVGKGSAETALPIARRLNEISEDNQVANLVLLAESVKQEDFATAAEMLASGETVGELVDGLALAWIQFGEGRMSEALGSFDEVAKAPGLQNFGLYHKALALAVAGDLEGADEILSGRSGVTLPATRRGVLAHVEILSQLERNPAAIELMDTVFGENLDPTLAAIREQLDSGEMLPFKTITSARDGVAEVFYSIAGALTGEADAAYTLLYTRMTEYLRPDHVDAILLTAQLLEELGRHELATSVYNQIPADDPAFHAAELGRAEAQRQSGDIDGAIKTLQKLSESHAGQASVHIALADILRREERYEEANSAYDEAIALFETADPAQWAIYFARGITYERTDRWELAEADFRKALELEPDQPQVLNYLGYSFVEQRENLDEALNMIERAVAERPDDGYITDSLGWVLYRLGRYDESVGHMERAAELTPSDPIVNDHLGDVYWAVDRRREAEFQWHRALSFEPEDKDAERIRRKLEVGLDVVLEEEGGDPIARSKDG